MNKGDINSGSRCRYRYALAFLVLGGAVLLLAWRTTGKVPAVLLNWTAVSLFVLGVAYLVRWTGVFGKTSDGRMRLLPALVMLPFLMFTWLVWLVQNRCVSASIWNRVSGVARSVEEAIGLIRQERPAVAPNFDQRQFLG